MSEVSPGSRDVAAVERGQIIQRVLVDGWSIAQVAAVFGLHERQIARWVAAYRRHGMASLRDDATLGSPPRRWLRRLRGWFARVSGTLGGEFDGHSARCIVLRRDKDARDLRHESDRRSLWN